MHNAGNGGDCTALNIRNRAGDCACGGDAAKEGDDKICDALPH